MAEPNNLTRIVLTGGPCGGKTSIMAYLRQELQEHGVHVIPVPETARMILGAGFFPIMFTSRHVFQENIIRTQILHEDLFASLHAARVDTPERTVMLCDRGTMDSKAYNSAFDELVRVAGWTVAELRDKRYDAVIHLVTAAKGAEEYYVMDRERVEDLELARMLDTSTQHAWVGHPHLSVIDNSTDFEGKKRRTLAQVLHHLGMPVPIEIERKYLVKDGWLLYLPEHARRISIEQIYLPSERGEERIRCRSDGLNSVCYRTFKRSIGNGAREEREWQIPLEEYLATKHTIGGGLRIQKDRWCFLYENQYFELDDFSPMGKKLSLLEIELTSHDTPVQLPEWLQVEADVTDDPAYTNHEIAR